MQKRLISSLVLLCVLTAFSVFFAFLRVPFLGNLVSPYDSSKNPVNIVFKYGYDYRNELNTFNGTFTKDLIIDGTATTRLILSQEELSQIQRKLFDIGFYDFPNIFPSTGVVTPRADYYLKVQNGSTVKEATWYSDSFSDANTDLQRVESDLNQLYRLITGMIEGKLEFKLLPAANGAYC